MPELPEVETMRRGLEPTLGGTIRRVEFPAIPYRPIQRTPKDPEFCQRAVGRRIVAIDRIAKRVLVRLDNQDSIVMQPKMAGLTLISEPPSEGHIRMIVQLGGAKCERFLYWDRRGLGTIHLWSAQECESYLGPSVLGPDALAIAFPDFFERFHRTHRPVKPALLDQKRVAGVGNLYASEILHQAGVHPAEPCSSISRSRWQRIFEAMQHILLQAIASEGSTLQDGTYRNAINGEGSYQAQHQVYARDGQPCLRCGRCDIVRIVQAQRSTFFCPRCQKEKR
jgi:formamidopyrimidine-DNA glycosylase